MRVTPMPVEVPSGVSNGVHVSQPVKQARMETVELTLERVRGWTVPQLQRAKTINSKVAAVACEIKRTGVIPGVIHLGKVGGEVYVVDGQHRIAAFELSGIASALADVRTVEFETMAAMGVEFVNLNRHLVVFKADDVLRGMEEATPALARIRERCDFVGYGNVRRGGTGSGPVVSMSIVLRCWVGSAREVPGGGMGAASEMAENMTVDEAEQCIEFLTVAAGAWGRDPEYYRLWGSLNVCICMWMWRRTVTGQDTTARSVKLDAAQFGRGLMGLSADSTYLDWLLGRNINDRDRSPCYARIRAIFARRLAEEFPGKKPAFPSPAWLGGVR